jgi:hypothetical protein
LAALGCVAMIMMATALVQPSFAQSQQKVVDAKKGWQATGLVVNGPGTIAFRAAGTWTFNPGLPAVDANGNCKFSTQGRTMYAFSRAGGCEGQLIGRIGKSRPFIVGANSSHAIAADERGPPCI